MSEENVEIVRRLFARRQALAYRLDQVVFSQRSARDRVLAMAETRVDLVRLPGTSEVECKAFLQCLYSHIEHGPHRDKTSDAEREVLVLEGMQPVDVPGAEDLAAARTAVAEAAMTCHQDWARLYRLAE
jgi:hypothetical protein